MPTGAGGVDWDSAGSLEVGWSSIPTPDPDGIGTWWKFTPATSGTLFFDVLNSVFADTVADPLAEAWIKVRVYTGASSGTAALEAEFADTVRGGEFQFAGRGAFAVTAGVEYHVAVFPQDSNTVQTVLSVSVAQVGEAVQPDDETIQHDTAPFDTLGHGIEAHFDDGGTGTRTTSELQTDLNTALGSLPAYSVPIDSLFAESYLSGAAGRSQTGLGPVMHSSVADAQNFSYGIRFSDGADPYAWTLTEDLWPDPLAGGIEYDGGGLTTYQDTRLDYGMHLRTETTGTMDVPTQTDVNIGPSPDPDGSGRTFYTATSSGTPPFNGTETPDYGSEYITAADANVDGIIYITPQTMLKTGVWAGAVATSDPNNETVEADVRFSVRGPDPDFTGYPQRFDRHTPPQFQLLFAGPVRPSLLILPPRRLYPRDDSLGIGRGRDYPPPTTQQAGRRFGSGSPV